MASFSKHSMDEAELADTTRHLEPRSAFDGVPLATAAVETVEAMEDSNKRFKFSKKKKKKKEGEDKDGATLPPAPYWKLYSGADRVDKLLIAVGFFCAAANGAALPGFTLVFGKVINTIGGAGLSLTAAEFESEINSIVLDFLYIAIGTGIASYFEVCFWMLAGARQARRLRERYVEAVLRQDITFFDTMASSGKLLQGVNEDSVAVQQAIGEKVGNFIHNIGTCVVGIIIAFVKGWSMTLVIVALVPFLASLGVGFATIVGKYTDKGTKAYAEANQLAQESLGNMRTVVAFNGQEQTTMKYSMSLALPEKVGIKAGFFQGMILGCFNSFFMFSYALALWYGSTRILAGEYNGGKVLNVLFAALIGGFALGMAAPNIQYFVAGKSAWARMEEVMNRKPPIDEEDDGETPEKVVGGIELRNINFYYPARPDVRVLHNFSIRVAPGTSVALCGQSGSGKSTVVQLVERFYDPAGGQVLFDGRDIRSLNLAWYRSHVGLVSQEPTLFATTILANIAFGKPGASQEEIEAAARTANAHGFISKLPLGYNTSVGEKGIQLSGGQKQRIAIARAILKNPQVVLLDEATSALDNSSERQVQLALDRLNQGRTTIVIAHRLSTIIHCNQIAVVREGEIVEQGSHEELIHKQDGAYATLVGLQMSALAQKDGSLVEAAIEDPADEELIEMASKKSLGDSRRSLDPKGSMRGSFEVKVISSEESSDDGLKAKRARTWWDRLLRRHKAAEEPEEKVNASFTRLLSYNRPELLYAIPGCIASGVLGAVMPGFALALSTITSAFFSPSAAYLKHTVAVWCGVFAAIGFAALISGMIQGYCFTLMGARLTRRMRVLMMRSLMRQDMAFFDKEENASGSLTARLGVDTTSIRGAVGDQMGIIVQNLVTFIMGYIIAFTAGWKMTLVITAVLPLLIFATWTESKFMQGFSDSAVQLYDAANQAAADAFGACRTVAAFSLRNQIKQLYSQLLDAPEKASNKRAQASGLGYGFSQFCMMAIYALGFYYGGKLIAEGEMNFQEMLKVFFAILLAAMGISQARMTFPDITKAAGAIQRVFAVIDRKSPIDYSDPGGDKLKEVRGNIQLRSVRFSYPERPEVVVFQDFSLRVDAGKTVALCGQSGSGKSSIVALVQRFYDPSQGAVLLDGVDIRSLNLQWLRSKMAVVAQEPVLFTGSIMDNIRYGRPEASLEDVQQAAKLANAISFIQQAPQGFNTPVGDGGIQLSGGQRQRIAIARAVIINPKILLLDEATSALDASSEKLVQAALDGLMGGRTTLVVAHRLSTIRNADSIAVLQEGKILEQGSHDVLISRQGAYRALIAQQQRG